MITALTLFDTGKSPRICVCGCGRSLEGFHKNREVHPNCEKEYDRKRRLKKEHMLQNLKESRRREQVKEFIKENFSFWLQMIQTAQWMKKEKPGKLISFETVLQETKRVTGIGVNNNLRRFLREELEGAVPELKGVFRKR